MKFRRKLVIYYLIAALLSMFFVGVAVLKGIENLSMETVEQQLIGESRLAEAYISQIAALENSSTDGLNRDMAEKIIDSLSLSLGNVRIYDKNLNLLAASEGDSKYNLPSAQNKSILDDASKGNYAYMVYSNSAYFSSSLGPANNILGVMEIIYPLDFLDSLINNVTGILSIGALVFAALLSALSIYIAGRITRPINQLSKAVKNYANRDFSPVKIKSSDELAELGHSFNVMGSQLNEYIKRQKQFVSNVSHELRTPLTAIMGYSEILINEVGNRPDLQKAVYHLKNESKRLSKLVDEILLLSRIDSGQDNSNFAKVDLSLLVKEAVDKMHFRAEKYDVRILTDVKSGIFVLGDSGKLIQALVNLLDNAIKFSPPQSLVHVKLFKENNLACITIIDQGMGVPQDEIPKVFERFYRAENAGGVTGTGLGLSIVKEIVDLHSGTVELISCIGNGTRVTIKLPAQ